MLLEIRNTNFLRFWAFLPQYIKFFFLKIEYRLINIELDDQDDPDNPHDSDDHDNPDDSGDPDDQTSIKLCRQQARESQIEPGWARESQNEPNSEPERAREGQSEPDNEPEKLASHLKHVSTLFFAKHLR